MQVLVVFIYFVRNVPAIHTRRAIYGLLLTNTYQTKYVITLATICNLTQNIRLKMLRNVARTENLAHFDQFFSFDLNVENPFHKNRLKLFH